MRWNWAVLLKFHISFQISQLFAVLCFLCHVFGFFFIKTSKGLAFIPVWNRNSSEVSQRFIGGEYYFLSSSKVEPFGRFQLMCPILLGHLVKISEFINRKPQHLSSHLSFTRENNNPYMKDNRAGIFKGTSRHKTAKSDWLSEFLYSTHANIVPYFLKLKVICYFVSLFVFNLN